MVELNNIDSIERVFSQMNGEVSSQFSDLIKKTIVDTLRLSQEKEEVDYSKIYYDHSIEFEAWLIPKFSRNYKVSMCNSIRKIFENDVSEIMEIKKLIETGVVTRSSSSKAFRVFLNFLEEREIISDYDLIRARKKIKIFSSNNADKFVPKEEDILQTICLLKSHEYPKELLSLYKFMLESGCRVTELIHLLRNYDPNNVEEFEDIITYRNFYLRGSKSSYYLFSTKETFKEIVNIIKKCDLSIIEYFQRKLHRNRDLVNLKYLRKYNFTKLIENGVEIDFANFIQGRASKNIGFTNYLAKQRLSIPRYSNFVKSMYVELN